MTVPWDQLTPQAREVLWAEAMRINRQAPNREVADIIRARLYEDPRMVPHYVAAASELYAEQHGEQSGGPDGT
jgi:hypothetical protein